RDVVGNGQCPEHVERLQQSDRNEVVGGKERVGHLVSGPAQKGVTRLPPLEDRQRISFDVLDGDAGRLRRRPTRPGETVSNLAEFARSADDSDPATPGVDEVAYGQISAGDIVDRHGREPAVSRLTV